MPQPLVGIDEVGRGCLAGPVYAAAVFFQSDIDVIQYKDSKITNSTDRKELALSIKKNHFYAVGSASVDEVDQLNILQATFLAMRRSVELLSKKINLSGATLLIDGRDKIPNLAGYQQLPIIKGDQHVSLISAASLVAKVERDQFMTDLSAQFKKYGFEKHKGYGTQFHRQQIQKFGPTKWHRQTFSGVREYI